MKRKWIVCAVIVLLMAVTVLLSMPRFRAELFVSLYREKIEQGFVPAPDAVFLGYQSANRWEGVHPMTEFILFTRGDTYYGVYYSPEDVPLGFQNVTVELVLDGQGGWVWTGEGDNHGATSRITGCWYYFEASF